MRLPQRRESSATTDAAASTTSEAGLTEMTPEHSGWKAVTVEHLDGERYVIGVRGHLVTADQPLADGGADTAPTPTELLIASLACSAAFYAGWYLDCHGFSRRGLRVTADFTMAADRPARVETVSLTAVAPSLPEDRRAAFKAVISRCIVHNTLRQTPRIDIEVE